MQLQLADAITQPDYRTRPRSDSYYVRAARRFLRLKVGLLGLVLLLIILVAAIAAPLVSPYSPHEQDLLARLLPPLDARSDGSLNLMGTDHLGRDVLSRVIWGARASLTVSILGSIIALIFGVVLGSSAGYIGGWLDNLVMRIADVQLAFPFLLLAISIIGVLGPSIKTIVAVLALSAWVQFARVVRSEVVSLRSRDYVDAARVIGAGEVRIVGIHILPNIVSSIIIILTLELGRLIILESGLSFLGLGVRPPMVSWGTMLAEGRNYLRDAWWLPTFSGLAITLVVLATNFVGDALRDALDPKLKID